MTNPKYQSEHIAAREKLIADAIAAGKFSSDRANFYRGHFDADPDGTRRVIARLAAVGPTDPTRDILAKLPAYPERWLSASERRTRDGGRPRIQTEVG